MAELGERHAALTPRQVEVARLLPNGTSAVAVAQRLVLSEHTVRSHVRLLLRRTSCPNLQALAVWVYVHRACCMGESGLLPPEVQGALVAAEAGGLAGDVALDWLKIQLVEENQNGIWDEGYVGSVCTDPVETLFGVKCPRTYLPGLSRTPNAEGGFDHHVDFRGPRFRWWQW